MKRLVPFLALALFVATAAHAKVGDYFARDQKGRVYTGTAPFGDIARWKDEACRSSFELRPDSGGKALRYTLDWKKVFSVRSNTKSTIDGDRLLPLYAKGKTVVLDGQGAVQTTDDAGGPVAFNNFEFFLKDPAKLEPLLAEMKTLQKDC